MLKQADKDKLNKILNKINNQEIEDKVMEIITLSLLVDYEISFYVSTKEDSEPSIYFDKNDSPISEIAFLFEDKTLIKCKIVITEYFEHRGLIYEKLIELQENITIRGNPIDGFMVSCYVELHDLFLYILEQMKKYL